MASPITTAPLQAPQKQDESSGQKRRRSDSPAAAEQKADTAASDGPAPKRRRSNSPAAEPKTKTITAASLASIPRAKKVTTSKLSQPSQSKDQRREPPPRPRSPSPAPAERSPPRQRKRPGAVRSVVDKEATRVRQEEREAEQRRQIQEASATRGVQDVVRQHYNSVEQRGREWRKTESKIKGLRSFNNWIKSAIIQRFCPDEQRQPDKRLLVLDIGCGKGGDLQKWHAAPQNVELYVGFDDANVSIDQARDRYLDMRKKNGSRGRPLFEAEFGVRDCFGAPLQEAQIVQQVCGRTGGFDIVTMMFVMHYAFESEQKAKNMIRNVAGCLRKGGRFIGTIPSSEVINTKLAEYHAKRGVQPVIQEEDESSDDEWDPEKPSEPKPVATSTAAAAPSNGDLPDDLEWGNSIYSIKVPKAATFPIDGIYRPPYGWRYNYWLEEAVEAPEFVVPFAAFRALASEYGLELRWEKPFNKIWDEERSDRILGPLSERMGVMDRMTGQCKVSDVEFEATSFYRAFCFYKT